jgi:serine/threonine protein kinase/tetratricopeptide (TPR) repeat protein
MIGETIAHYKILRKLGKGGMGEVFLARDTKLDRKIALKVLPPEAAEDQGKLERFRREAKAVASLNHPNIVTIYSVEEIDGLHFLTMEYVEGKALSETVPSNGLQLQRFFDIAIPLADALSTAHERGIIHRDLKPRNVMVDRDGRVRVLDFGLAKLLPSPRMAGMDAESTQPTEILTGEGQVVGTTPYMSPEQLRGRQLDARSDIFSLGILLYWMSTGRHPFSRDSSADVISAILSADPPPVTEIREEMPRHLGRVIRHCLEKEPSDRFQTSLDVRNELRGLRDEVSSGTAPRSSESLFPDEPKERQGLWPKLAMITALLIVGVGGFLLWRAKPAEPQDLKTLAVLPFANLTGDPANDHQGEVFSSGLMYELSDLYGIQLVGRSEVASLVGEQVGASEIGERLGVGAVVEGEILDEGGRQRVVVSFTDTATGFVLWSEPYTAKPSELHWLQEDVARDLESLLSIPLTPKERRRLAEDPAALTRAYAHYVRGRRFLDQTEDPTGPESAADNFRQSIRLHPELAIARAGLSEALWQIYHRDLDPEMLAQAEEQARLALEQDPDLPAAHVALACVLRSTGQTEASIEALEEALSGHPNPDQAYRELADSYERIGELEEAERYLRTATALNEADWLNWNWLGALLAKLGRYEEAREAFENAVRVAPDYIYQPLENLGTLYLFEADYEAAIETYERIPEPIPYALLASNIATAYFFQGDMEKAVEYFRMAVEMDPMEAELRRNYGDVLLRIGDAAAAEAQYREAVALMDAELAVDPGNAELERRRTMYSAKAGDCESAVPKAVALKRDQPPTAFSAHEFAYVFALCGARDLAVNAVRESIELGISPELLAQEDEFALLREDPEFLTLTGAEPPG